MLGKRVKQSVPALPRVRGGQIIIDLLCGTSGLVKGQPPALLRPCSALLTLTAEKALETGSGKRSRRQGLLEIPDDQLPVDPDAVQPAERGAGLEWILLFAFGVEGRQGGVE